MKLKGCKKPEKKPKRKAESWSFELATFSMLVGRSNTKLHGKEGFGERVEEGSGQI